MRFVPRIRMMETVKINGERLEVLGLIGPKCRKEYAIGTWFYDEHAPEDIDPEEKILWNVKYLLPTLPSAREEWNGYEKDGEIILTKVNFFDSKLYIVEPV